MGKHFGELYKLRGIVQFKISPHEQNPLAGIISHGVPNMIRRIRSQIFYVLPPLIFTYVLYDWAESDHEKRQRKAYYPNKFCGDE